MNTEIKTVYLAQGELCDLLQVTRVTVRNWTNKGWFTPPRRAAGRAIYDLRIVKQDVVTNCLRVDLDALTATLDDAE